MRRGASHQALVGNGLADFTGGMAVGAGKAAIEGGQILETAVERDVEDRAFGKPDEEIAGAAQSRRQDARPDARPGRFERRMKRPRRYAQMIGDAPGVEPRVDAPLFDELLRPNPAGVRKDPCIS